MTNLAAADAATELCIECGMCCDGSLFADVTITDPSEAEQMRAHRIPVRVIDERHQFDQPCPALDSGGCSIYADRPVLCHSYRCLLLKQVQAGAMSLSDARLVVAETRQREREVKALLVEHVPDDGTPLRQLFRQFQLDHEDQLESGDLRAARGEVLKRYAHHRAQLAQHFEPSLATSEPT